MRKYRNVAGSALGVLRSPYNRVRHNYTYDRFLHTYTPGIPLTTYTVPSLFDTLPNK